MQSILNIEGEVTESGELVVDLPPEAPRGKVVLTLVGAESGAELHRQLGKGQCVRVTGRLDAIRLHDQSFELALPTGETLRGIAPTFDLRQVRSLVDESVMVSGRAYFDEAEGVEFLIADLLGKASERDAFWAQMPQPAVRRLDLESIDNSRPSGQESSTVFGKWPGDETDEEVFADLEALS